MKLNLAAFELKQSHNRVMEDVFTTVSGDYISVANWNQQISQTNNLAICKYAIVSVDI